MPQYTPRPVDTSAVALDPSLLELAEYLARNTHEVWAAARIREGWSYGPRRDDAAKQHPDLVPYEQLPTAEKSYDRDTAMQAIKLVAALGYRILLTEGPAFVAPAEGSGTPSAPILSAADPAQLSLSELVSLWRHWEAGRCRGVPQVYGRLADRALALGECVLAYDVLKEGLRYHPADPRLRQRQALALARGGAAETAAKALEQLRAEGHSDEETLGLIGRCYKDLWEESPDTPAGKERLLAARDAYEEAYRLHGGYWSAINAATLSACLGEESRSRAHALHAREQCLNLLDHADAGEPYWPLATIAEACLVLGELGEAERYYTEASRAAAGRFGDVSSTRRHARLLLRHRGLGPAQQAEQLGRWLPLPRVVIFSGHRIDAPGRAAARFPAQLEHAVAGDIRLALDRLDCGFGFASAAGGADILFLEAVLKRGGEATIVLPYDAESFLQRSVAGLPGLDWEGRFRRLLASPGVRVVTASQGPPGDEATAAEYANLLAFGLAGIRARHLGTDLAPLAVWDGQPGDGPGGTADAVARWRGRGCPVTIVDLAEMLRREMGGPGAAASAKATDRIVPADSSAAEGRGDAVRRQMAALLFADVIGYSKLFEAEIPLFVRHFMGPAARLAEAAASKPLHVSTWGDGLYFVFASVADAGRFALGLTDFVTRTDWISLGFRTRLALRTALHAGPVHAYTNPATGRPDYCGTHVSRAARLEPVTPPGHVYASEAFAAIAFAERAAGFRCDYVGRVGLAKDYGTFPTYHVRRGGPPSDSPKALK